MTRSDPIQKNNNVARVGVIDIGSNSVRMVIFEGTQTLFNEKELCALGKTIPATGRLYPDGVTKALATLKTYLAAAQKFQVSHMIAVATAALRDATDGPALIAQFKTDLGLDVRTLSGNEEAYYAARGVLSTRPDAHGVVADLGGGSLELARLAGGRVHECISLALGAQRLIAYGSQADEKIEEILATAPRAMIPAETLYVIGGSWRALANAFLADDNQPKSAFDGLTLTAERLISFAERVARMDTDRLVRNYRIEAGRAELLPVSARLLIAVVRHFGADTVVISKAGIRDGLYQEYRADRT